MKKIYLALFVLLGEVSYSQVATWNFDAMNTTGSGGSGVTASNASFGSGVTSPTFPSGNPVTGLAYNGTSWTTSMMRDDNDYIEVCATRSADNMYVSGITFDERRSGTGVTALEVRYSTNNFSTSASIGTGVIPDNTDFRTQNFTIAGGVATQNICFRIYGYAAEAGTGTWRFDNIRINGQPLPVRLLSFQSEPTQEGVNLSWQTSEEVNNSHFEVQRSSDAQNFEAIGRVAGRGNSTETNTYTLLDASPRLGLNYYRLKQVDFDGKFEYSRVIVAQYDGNGTFRAYPNPTTDQLSIELPKNTEAALYELFDTQGRSLKRFSKREEVSLLGVPTGQYWLQVQTTEGTILKQRIIKN